MPFPKNERVSITHVAKEANVSIQTVSRVINEQPGVSLKTRERILKLIDDLGYYPSRAAKAMRGSSQTLGIVGYGLELYGPSRTLIGAQREASKNNYGIVLELVQDPEDVDVRAIFEMMLSNHVDGIIWCIPHIGSNIDEVVQHLGKIPVPVIFTDASAELHDLTVINNNYLGGKLATRHLTDTGHRAIGLVTGPMAYFSARERQRGWQDALRDIGVEWEAGWVFEGDWSPQSGALALKQFIAQHPELTAIFASNDQMALGILYAAEQFGLVVPNDLDLVVVGYDDIPEAAFFHPALSSVRQDVADLGASAVSQIIQAIDSLALRGSYLPQTVVIEPELVIRASSTRT
jgi:LacI family transcriptional regulator